MTIKHTVDLIARRVRVVMNFPESNRGTIHTTYEGTVTGVSLGDRFLFLANADIVGVTQGAGMTIGVDLLNPNLVRLVVLE